MKISRKQFLIFSGAGVSAVIAWFALRGMLSGNRANGAIPTRVSGEGIFAGTNPIRLGDASAPVELIEFGSFTCPHCANFHVTTLSKLVDKEIREGSLTAVYFDFPLDQLALLASIVVRCIDDQYRKAVLDILYQGQAEWAQGPQPEAELISLVKLFGVDQATYEKCKQDAAIIKTIQLERQLGEDVYQVNATPTIFINGKLQVDRSLANLRKVIAEATVS